MLRANSRLESSELITVGERVGSRFDEEIDNVRRVEARDKYNRGGDLRRVTFFFNPAFFCIVSVPEVIKDLTMFESYVIALDQRQEICSESNLILGKSLSPRMAALPMAKFCSTPRLRPKQKRCP